MQESVIPDAALGRNQAGESYLGGLLLGSVCEELGEDKHRVRIRDQWGLSGSPMVQMRSHPARGFCGSD